MNKIVVLDTSVIIDRKVVEIIEAEKPEQLIIPYVVLDELQSQASKGRDEGYIGLEHLKVVRKICKDQQIELSFQGERPTLDDIKLAGSGRLDALIRDVSRKNQGVLFTSDYVQSLVGEAEGIKTHYVPKKRKKRAMSFKRFFTPDTMSIHLKQGASPLAKRGGPGSFNLVKIRLKALSEKELKLMISQIMEVARREEKIFIEIDEPGATVIQMGEYRIALAKPPFSDKLEITVVRPLVKLRLQDYRLSSKLMNRLKSRAEGVLIAGPPGSGKTTFVSSLADFYSSQGKITKTLESPRDLQVCPEITQYTPLNGDFAKTASLLLLVRPDYTIFDELRENSTFTVFADMRLAGVGMIGVVHAAGAVDAVKRFISRVELGMIPSVIDTVIFIKSGKIEKIYDLSLTVKVPTGMFEADLARPLVEVKDFETGKLEYEIYTFGKENVVVPINEEEKKVSAVQDLALQRITQSIQKYDKGAQIELTGKNRALIKVDKKVIPRIIGKNGKNISKIEKNLGIQIDIEPK
ncbi:MAG: PINc/VapC family ATPase [Candidatus Bathyarchaeota archaeon]|nr:PINc/VapC family ATPase [Candidatus Bathyarchaeum tardum]